MVKLYHRSLAHSSGVLGNSIAGLLGGYVTGLLSGIVISLPTFFSHEFLTLPLLASVGVAVFPDDGTDAETVIKHADVAMYRAKEKGRNIVQVYTPVLNAAVTTRLAIPSMRDAISVLSSVSLFSNQA